MTTPIQTISENGVAQWYVDNPKFTIFYSSQPVYDVTGEYVIRPSDN